MRICLRFLFILSMFGMVQGVSGQAPAQESFFRHFTVQIKNLTVDDFEKLQKLCMEEAHIDSKTFCTQTSTVLFDVEASHPKRIDDIKKELEALVATEIPARRILSIETLSDNNIKNFCK